MKQLIITDHQLVLINMEGPAGRSARMVWMALDPFIDTCMYSIYIYSTHSIVNNVQLDHIPQGEQRQLCKSAAILEIRGWNFSL